jgi:hypothetical protein
MIIITTSSNHFLSIAFQNRRRCLNFITCNKWKSRSYAAIIKNQVNMIIIGAYDDIIFSIIVKIC